jgi:hypothetical protein
MPTMQDSKKWLLCLAGAIALSIMPFMMSSVSAYSGGFYDDGLYDDDWYFDYYEKRATGGSENADTSDTVRSHEQYEVGQLYENADESGLFREEALEDQ